MTQLQAKSEIKECSPDLIDQEDGNCNEDEDAQQKEPTKAITDQQKETEEDL